MGFFDDLKELGTNLKGVVVDLGQELGQIAKDTADEIKSDPGKFFTDSTKEIASAAATLGKLAIDQAVPQMSLAMIKKGEEQLSEDALTEEQRSEFLTRRKKAATTEIQFLKRLLERVPPDENNLKSISERLNVMEKSLERLESYLDLPNLNLEQDDIQEAKEIQASARDKIYDLRESVRTAKSK